MGTTPPYGATPQIGAPQDYPGENLYYQLEQFTTDPDYVQYKAVAQAILAQLGGQPHDLAIIKSCMDTVFNNTYGSCDALMEFNLSPTLANGFNYIICGAIYPDAYEIPTQFTASDTAYGSLVDWTLSPQMPQDMLPLAQAFMDSFKSNIGSSGTITAPEINQLLDQNIFIDPNFFTNFPTVTPSSFGDLQAFANVVSTITPGGYSLAPMMPYYLDMNYNWPNPNKNADDTQLQQYEISLMRTYWTFEAPLLMFQQFAEITLNHLITIYPNIDLQGAVNLETVLEIPPAYFPALQSQYFAAQTWVASLTPGTPACNMAQVLMNELSTLWPSGDVQGWYNTTFATQDLFMQYYNVDNADIQKFYQIANNTTGTLSATTTDNNYCDAMNYRDTFGSSTPDYKLMDALGKKWYQYGSNPTPSQLQMITQWARGEIGSSVFMHATSTTQQKFASYFDYSVTLAYFNEFLMIWGGRQMPLYQQHFAAAMRSIISGYIQTHPNPTQADFQNYLNANYSNTDFCFQFPGLSAWYPAILFANFGLQSPHTYTMIDNAYAILYNSQQMFPPAPGSADATAFAIFYEELQIAEKNYDPNNPNADLFKTYIQPWISDLKKTDLWNKLTPQTQTTFNLIYGLEPSNVALTFAKTAQMGAKDTPLDVRVLEQVMTALKTPGEDTVVLIRKLQDSADWDQLAPATKETLQGILHMLSTPQ